MNENKVVAFEPLAKSELGSFDDSRYVVPEFILHGLEENQWRVKCNGVEKIVKSGKLVFKANGSLKLETQE